MKKRFSLRMAGVFLLFAVCIVFLLWASGRIGVPRFRLEQDLRSSQHIPDSWIVVGDVTEEAAVYLFYPPGRNTYGVTVYRNEPGLSFGYFFRGSHTVAGMHGTTEELPAKVERISSGRNQPDRLYIPEHRRYSADGAERWQHRGDSPVERPGPFCFAAGKRRGSNFL